MTSVLLTGTLALAADEAPEWNWQRHLLDGVCLSGNYDIRYLHKPSPIDLRVVGKTAKEASQLNDGNDTAIGCASGEQLEITLDLKTECLISGIAFQGVGQASWTIAFSRDGQDWTRTRADRVVSLADQGEQVAGNLALPARYLRLTVVGRGNGYSLQDIFIYGESSSSNLIGGIYPSSAIPVAGQSLFLQAVVRNASSQPLQDVQTVFEQTVPGALRLGIDVITEIPPYSAALARVKWQPSRTEQHKVTVTVAGNAATKQSVVIPVVKYPLLLTSFHPLDNARLRFQNIYTTAGDGATVSHESLLHRVRGRSALAFCLGPHAMPPNQTAKEYAAVWSSSLSTPFRNGIALDEWGESYPGARDAFRLVRKQSPRQTIAVWLSGGPSVETADALGPADLVIIEKYLCLLHAHNIYRDYLGPDVAGMRTQKLFDKWIIALGLGVDDGIATLEQIEREVRFLRASAPELRGMAYYGYRPELAGAADALNYKYFIAPVCMLEPDAVVSDRQIAAIIRNSGGMTARHVLIEVLDPIDQSRLGRIDVPELPPDQSLRIKIPLTRAAAAAKLRIVPDAGYTSLESVSPVEVLPKRVVRGMFLTLCWTPRGNQTVHSKDRFEIISAQSGRVVREVKNDGTWSARTGNVYQRAVPTADLSPGDYSVRYILGESGIAAGSDTFSVVAPAGKFQITKINDAIHRGDPQSIDVSPGDTFEIAWDLTGAPVDRPAIYLSAPDDPLVMPREDGSYGLVSAVTLCRLTHDSRRKLLLKGNWTWKTDLSASDLTDLDDVAGWLSGGRDPLNPRINMARNPGAWRLWVGEEHEPGTSAFPVSPVVSIQVSGNGR